MLTCREMVQLSSDVIDNQLSQGMRVAVYVHLRQCQNCRLYIRQFALTSAVLKKLAAEVSSEEIEATLVHIQRAIDKRAD